MKLSIQKISDDCFYDLNGHPFDQKEANLKKSNQLDRATSVSNIFKKYPEKEGFSRRFLEDLKFQKKDHNTFFTKSNVSWQTVFKATGLFLLLVLGKTYLSIQSTESKNPLVDPIPSTTPETPYPICIANRNPNFPESFFVSPVERAMEGERVFSSLKKVFERVNSKQLPSKALNLEIDNFYSPDDETNLILFSNYLNTIFQNEDGSQFLNNALRLYVAALLRHPIDENFCINRDFSKLCSQSFVKSCSPFFQKSISEVEVSPKVLLMLNMIISEALKHDIYLKQIESTLMVVIDGYEADAVAPIEDFIEAVFKRGGGESLLKHTFEHVKNCKDKINPYLSKTDLLIIEKAVLHDFSLNLLEKIVLADLNAENTLSWSDLELQILDLIFIKQKGDALIQEAFHIVKGTGRNVAPAIKARQMIENVLEKGFLVEKLDENLIEALNNQNTNPFFIIRLINSQFKEGRGKTLLFQAFKSFRENKGAYEAHLVIKAAIESRFHLAEIDRFLVEVFNRQYNLWYMPLVEALFKQNQGEKILKFALSFTNNQNLLHQLRVKEIIIRGREENFNLPEIEAYQIYRATHSNLKYALSNMRHYTNVHYIVKRIGYRLKTLFSKKSTSSMATKELKLIHLTSKKSLIFKINDLFVRVLGYLK